MTLRAYLLCGPSLSGKSSVAARLVHTLGVAVISADAINAERGLPFGGEGLPESVWAETLRIQVERFHRFIAQGRSVVVDDTLCYRWLRDRWRREASAAAADPTLLVLRAAKDELLARHAVAARSGERQVLSVDRLLEHVAAFEWPTADEMPVDVTAHEQRERWLQAQPRPPVR